MDWEQISKAAYLGSIVLFILALGGLSHPETARRGNLYGILGMTVALIATLAFITGNYAVLLVGLVAGGTLGLVLARRVQMTQMPELVAILHSLVGLAAVLVGFATFSMWKGTSTRELRKPSTMLRSTSES